jgi:Domain of unknown function (DUF4390)
MKHRLVWSVPAVLLAGAVALAAESLRIVPLVSEDRVLVSAELSDAYTDDVRAAIASGLRTTFTYEMELRVVATVWVDRTVATAVITMSDQYDNLTRRHSLARLVDGRVVETSVTENESVVQRWLTTLSRVPLSQASRLDPNRDYYVRIRARVRPRGGSLLGLTNVVTGQAKFTIIP